jgi:hypothetical protein
MMMKMMRKKKIISRKIRAFKEENLKLLRMILRRESLIAQLNVIKDSIISYYKELNVQ